MSAITTHVLDTARGRAAVGIQVELEGRDTSGSWRPIGRGATDADGRLRTLLPAGEPLVPGVYRLIFDVEQYFSAQDVRGFFPRIVVEFAAADGEEHYHVPILLSPFGYSTYRGT